MWWRDVAAPLRMQRVALVAPTARLRDLLVRVGALGTVELDRGESATGPGGRGDEVVSSLVHQGGPAAPSVSPRLSASRPDLQELGRAGRADLIAGETELEDHARRAVVRGEVAALAGWVPLVRWADLSESLAHVGAAAVPLDPPRGVDPPTLLDGGRGPRQAFSQLVETYGTVPYADADPSVLAGCAYVFMFGMMFGDAGHGVLLVLAGALLRAGRPHRLARFRKVWPFVAGSGAVAIVFGLLYGEFFGPTGVIPVVWLSPLASPLTVMAVALGVGWVLLAGAQGLGTANRWREGGWPLALSSPSGIAGAALLAGIGVVVLGSSAGLVWLVAVGLTVLTGGVALAYLGFLASSGGGATGVTQATVEVFDAVLRTGTNLVSFVRLAAFGLTHAAIGMIVWDATSSLWTDGGPQVLAACAVFLIGNVVAFALEGLVAGVQALRLEYYELFSRVFTRTGRPFRPWHVPTDPGSTRLRVPEAVPFEVPPGRYP